jgi:hypothetical protein
MVWHLPDEELHLGDKVEREPRDPPCERREILHLLRERAVCE